MCAPHWCDWCVMHRSGAKSTMDYAVPDSSQSASMSDLLSALLLGILEGLTEFLPISSTGHLLIAQHWLGERSDFFNIIIQAGAIIAITLVFRPRLWSFATGLNQHANSA